MKKLVATPPGVIWRQQGDNIDEYVATVTLEPQPDAPTSPTPTAVRLKTPTKGISVQPPVAEKDARQWTVEVRLAPSDLPTPHGSTSLEILDADNNVVRTIPVIWFSRSSLQAPARPDAANNR